MNNLDSFIGDSDSDKIENAIKACKNGEFMLPSRAEIVKDGRDYWLLDRAVLIPENTTILLRNCKIKLSDNCRDNFFRSANCGLGINNPEIIRNGGFHFCFSSSNNCFDNTNKIMIENTF